MLFVGVRKKPLNKLLMNVCHAYYLEMKFSFTSKAADIKCQAEYNITLGSR